MSKSKFKNTEELEKKYKELEREFTKKEPKLAEVEKTNYVTLLHNEMDSLLDDYAKRRISDLETKLAESEKKNFELVAKLNLKEHKPAFCTLADRDCEALGQVEELKQQLAEKEKALGKSQNYLVAENETLKLELADKEEYIKMLEEDRATLNNIVERYANKCKNHNQDKISFCIEQLEKVKEYFNGMFSLSVQQEMFDNYIDNQIKQLKEGK